MPHITMMFTIIVWPLPILIITPYDDAATQLRHYCLRDIDIDAVRHIEAQPGCRQAATAASHRGLRAMR